LGGALIHSLLYRVTTTLYRKRQTTYN
jgi:hypothetical protein